MNSCYPLINLKRSPLPPCPQQGAHFGTLSRITAGQGHQVPGALVAMTSLWGWGFKFSALGSCQQPQQPGVQKKPNRSGGCRLKEPFSVQHTKRVRKQMRNVPQTHTSQKSIPISHNWFSSPSFSGKEQQGEKVFLASSSDR